jgi:hypothetical protein
MCRGYAKNIQNLTEREEKLIYKCAEEMNLFWAWWPVPAI